MGRIESENIDFQDSFGKSGKGESVAFGWLENDHTQIWDRVL